MSGQTLGERAALEQVMLQRAAQLREQYKLDEIKTPIGRGVAPRVERTRLYYSATLPEPSPEAQRVPAALVPPTVKPEPEGDEFLTALFIGGISIAALLLTAYIFALRAGWI